MAKRKNAKKSKKNLEKIESVGNFDTDIWSKVFIVLSVVIVFLLFYLLTLYITNKNSDKKDKEQEEDKVKISYNTTIVGRSLSMSEGEYLVIFYDNSNEEEAKTYKDLVSGYTGGLKVYTVDMSKAFNKPYASDQSNRSPEAESDFLINGPTLIKVSDKKVSEYMEGHEEISNYLN